MDLSKDTTNNDNNPDFNSSIYCNTYGQMSDLFSSPVIPKMVVVGLNEEFVDSVAEREKLKMFKAILVKSLDNLFIVEFQEQVGKRRRKILKLFSLVCTEMRKITKSNVELQKPRSKRDLDVQNKIRVSLHSG